MTDVEIMNLALTIAKSSKDNSTKVGCVIVDERTDIVSTGFNAFARGVMELPERFERPAKYEWTVHAEMRALATAARRGNRTDGCTLYCTQVPCSICIGPIIDAGIRTIVCPKSDNLAPKWVDSTLTETATGEAGVIIVWFK